MQIITGVIKKAQKVLIYGPEGIGKSTFASKFPGPLFLDTEGSTARMDVPRAPKASSWTMLKQQIDEVKRDKLCETLIVDTIDWAEQMCVEHILAKYQKSGIEDFGYGNGYVYVKEEFGRLLNQLQDVVDSGINVVLTAHAQMRKFEQPDELGAYDRYELKLGKKTGSQTSPLVKEWADMVLFANYKTYVVNVDGQGAQKGKNKAQGGKRVMYTTHHNCWDAKNRHDLPEELPFEYQSIAHCIPTGLTMTQMPIRQEHPPVKEPEKLPPVANTPKEQKTDPSNDKINLPEPPKAPEDIPKALADLMSTRNMTEADVMEVVAQRGYFPKDTPLANCGSDFINGWVVPFFDKVCEMSRSLKISRGEFVAVEPDEIPFN